MAAPSAEDPFSFIDQSVGSHVRVTVGPFPSSGRHQQQVVEGRLRACDRHTNLVLTDAARYEHLTAVPRPVPVQVPLIIIRGSTILRMQRIAAEKSN